MRRLEVLNLGQRVVLVVALAAVLQTVGGYTVHRREWPGGALSRSTSLGLYVYGGDPGWHPVPAALVWIALIVVWALASIWLLGLPRRTAAGS